MTLSEAREALYARMAAQWADRTPVTHPNIKFDADAQDTSWVRMTVRSAERQQRSIGDVGNRQFEATGIVFFQIFTPVNQGMAAADTLVAAVKDIFESVRVSSTLVTRAASPREVGPDGKWYMVVVTVPFTYDEVR